MAIDGCQYTFDELARQVFPRYMAKLRQHIERPTAMAEFIVTGVGVATLLRRFGHTSDFRGCYIFIDNCRPVYVGISRSVIQRLRQHVRGTTHYDATLAYRIAATRHPHSTTRSVAMADADFQRRFSESQNYLRGMHVAFIEIPNPLELYLFEAYCAMELNTGEWNTFETH
jgi:hypothetical protein